MSNYICTLEGFNIKDAWLREQLSTLDVSGAQFIGIITDTDMKDGSTKTTVTLKSGGTHTAKAGDVIITDDNKEMFIYTNSNVWNLMGSTHGLGDLAFVDEAKGSVVLPDQYTTTPEYTYSTLKEALFNMPREADYTFSSTKTNIPVFIGEESTTGQQTGIEVKYTGLEERINTAKIGGIGTLNAVAVKDTAFVSVPMVMSTSTSGDPLSSIEIASKYTNLSKTLNFTTVSTTSSETVNKAPTFTQPTAGTDVSVLTEEELPTLSTTYTVQSSEKDPLTGEYDCGTLVFNWNAGAVLEISGGKATVVELPTEDAYTPIDVPDQVPTEVMADLLVGKTELLSQPIISGVNEGTNDPVAIGFGTPVTQDVIVGVKNVDCSIALTQDTGTSFNFGPKYAECQYSITNFTEIGATFEANVKIPEGITVGNTGVYSIANGKVTLAKEAQSVSGDITVKMSPAKHPLTVFPSK